MNWRDTQIISFKKKLDEKNDDLEKINFLLFAYNNTLIQATEMRLNEFIIDSLCDIQFRNLENQVILKKTTSFLKEMSRQEIQNDFGIITID
jgi:hypothetical protein